jgi:hypothetical protein
MDSLMASEAAEIVGLPYVMDMSTTRTSWWQEVRAVRL